MKRFLFLLIVVALAGGAGAVLFLDLPAPQGTIETPAEIDVDGTLNQSS